jgi:tRNA nucleotidyltransferase (CCA-adding enzyme)
MNLPSYFEDFLNNIRPEADEREAYKESHNTLRENLLKDDKINKITVDTFLQGSYRRNTAIKADGLNRSDVDVVVVTTINKENPASKALEYFEPFCERHYPKRWKKNDRSIGISLDDVDIDLVVTAAPSEAAEELLKSNWAKAERPPVQLSNARQIRSWIAKGAPDNFNLNDLKTDSDETLDWRKDPLLIPDRKFEKWEETHPLAQIEWTWEKNAKCNGHYINVVKAIKWWKRKHKTLPKHPKGYPLEHFIGATCPDGINSVAEGILQSLEQIAMIHPRKPKLPDHGVPHHDVFHRTTEQEYAMFHGEIKIAARLARKAYDATTVEESAKAWRELFGEEFPAPEDDNKSSGGFTSRTGPSTVKEGRFG